MLSFYDIPYKLAINNMPYQKFEGEIIKCSSNGSKFFSTGDLKTGIITIWNGEFIL